MRRSNEESLLKAPQVYALEEWFCVGFNFASKGVLSEAALNSRNQKSRKP